VLPRNRQNDAELLASGDFEVVNGPANGPVLRPTIPPLSRPRTPLSLLAARPLTSRPIYQQYIPPQTAPFSASPAGESSRLPQVTTDDADFFSQFDKTTGYVKPPATAPAHWNTAPLARADVSGSIPPVAIPAAPSTLRPMAMADESGSKGLVTSRTFVITESKKSRGPWAMMMVAFGCAVGILGSMAVVKYKAQHAAAPAAQETVVVAAQPQVVAATPVMMAQPTIPLIVAPPPATTPAPQVQSAFTNTNVAQASASNAKPDPKSADSKTASKATDKSADKSKTTKTAKTTWTAPKHNSTASQAPVANVTKTTSAPAAPAVSAAPKADASSAAMLKAAQQETGNSL
jgi:hypothetical protein